MITVLIETEPDGEALSRSLVPLVKGAMEGVVSNVLVFSHDPEKSAEIDRICDLSGAEHLHSQDFSGAIECAKDQWFLMLEAGARLEGDWLNGVVDHMNQSSKLGASRLRRLKTMNRGGKQYVSNARLIPR